MEKAKFTPGPWKIHTDEAGTISIYSTDKLVLPDVFDPAWRNDVDMDVEEEKEFKANAQLIAAAPDMLEVLRLVFKAETNARHDNKNILTDAGYNKIKQAIAKAEGN